MKMRRQLFVLVMALVIASPILAVEKKKAAKKAPACPAAQAVERMTKGMTISDEQKAKFDPIKKEFGPKLVALQKKRAAILKPEQQKAYNDARKAAEAEGKKGKELQAAAVAAMNLTDEQKPKLAEVDKETAQAYKELQKEIMDVLTPEQKEQIKKAAKKPAK
jgi:hypothetical protein